MISVCMITYNGEKYIKPQIDSILSQLDSEDELIISDNGSTDETKNIILNYHDKRIKFLDFPLKETRYTGTNKKCYVVGRNAENALRHAKGEIIFLADQDDLWLDGKVKACKEALKEDDLVITNHITVNKELKPVVDIHNLSKIKPPTILNTLFHTQFLGCCMAFRRNLLQYVLPFPKEPLMHDIWLGLMALKYGKIGLIQRPFLLYRRHESNASINIGEKSTNSLIFKICYRWYLLKSYLKR